MAEVENIFLDDLIVAFPLNMRVKMERSTTPSKTISRTAKKSSDGSHTKQGSRIGTAKPPAATVIVNNITEETNETPIDTPRSREERPGPTVYFGFDNCLGCKLQPIYTELSMAID